MDNITKSLQDGDYAKLCNCLITGQKPNIEHYIYVAVIDDIYGIELLDRYSVDENNAINLRRALTYACSEEMVTTIRNML